MDIKRNPQRSSPASRNTQANKRKPRTSLQDDLNETLMQIDDTNTGLGKKTKSSGRKEPKRGKKSKKPWSKKRKIITWSIIGVLLLLLGVGGYYAYRIGSSTSSIFQGSLLDMIKKDELKEDKFGRTNILIFGTSEDDPNHSGAQLADSIMVLSVDQETNDATTISIPRDLWVNFDQTCSVGNAGKINATYLCALQANNNDEDKASLAFASKVGEVIGTEIPYYVSVNYSVVTGLVDALGGVEVNVKSDDPRGIYDAATKLRLSNGTHRIDGDTALDFSRSRNAEGGYGLSQSNFDREKNQQEVLRAIQAKALQSGTLTNPNKVVGIVDSLGANIRTNVKSSELQTALQVAQGVDSGNMKSLPLNDKENPLVTTGRYGEQSIVQPVIGLTDYSQIHAYVADNFESNKQK